MFNRTPRDKWAERLLPTAEFYVGVGIAGAGLLSAGSSMFGSSSAADAQVKAAQIAAATQMAMYEKTRGDLQPYNQAGQTAVGKLTNRLDEFTAPIQMNQAQLEQTPGYQFNLSQGLRGVQNSAAARGLGASGAALKGAATFATGLADSTYQNQFNNAVTNQTNAYNRLMGLVNSGQNAAAQTGTAGTQAANGISQAYTNAGNAQAAAYNNMGAAGGYAANALVAGANKAGLFGGTGGLYGIGS